VRCVSRLQDERLIGEKLSSGKIYLSFYSSLLNYYKDLLIIVIIIIIIIIIIITVLVNKSPVILFLCEVLP